MRPPTSFFPNAVPWLKRATDNTRRLYLSSRRPVFLAALVAVGSTVPLSGKTASEQTSVPLDGLAADQLSVRELMRLETALALQNAKRKQHERLVSTGSRSSRHSAAPIAAHGLTSSTPELVAIYGVDQKLLAEVVFEQQSFVYMHGHVTPVGVKPGAAPFRLRAISTHCVELEKDTTTHRLCLHPRGSDES